MGINDNELGKFEFEYDEKDDVMTNVDKTLIFVLASQIWELAEGKTNSMDFAEAIDNSDLEAFGFTDDFVIELWGAVTDARSGRLR